MSGLRSLAVVAEPGMIAVLLRPDSDRAVISSKQKQIDEFRSLGVSLVAGDLANLSATGLAELLSPYDTVVSCTGFVGGSGTQRRIAQAALLAGVKRFVPWQFGVDYDVIGRGSAQDLFDEQLDVRDLLRSQTRTQWVIVSTGMFTSFLLEPAFGVFDLEQGVVHGLGSWDNAVTLTQTCLLLRVGALARRNHRLSQPALCRVGVHSGMPPRTDQNFGHADWDIEAAKTQGRCTILHERIAQARMWH
jgi:hypothetical protein